MHRRFLLAYLFCFIFLIGNTRTMAAPKLYDINPADYGRPVKLRSLTDLGAYEPEEKRSLPTLTKTKIMLVWLQKEFQSPTPTREGLGGGPISSRYIQAQIVKALSLEGDPVLLRSVAQDDNALPTVCDGANLALALMGDADRLQQIMHILEFDDNPYYRALAMDAVANLGSVDKIPVLKDSLDDPFAVYLFGKTALYPVRRAAGQSIKILSSPSDRLQSRVEQLQGKFRTRLESAEKAAQAEADSTPE